MPIVMSLSKPLPPERWVCDSFEKLGEGAGRGGEGGGWGTLSADVNMPYSFW